MKIGLLSRIIFVTKTNKDQDIQYALCQRQKDVQDMTAHITRDGFVSLWNWCCSLELHLLYFLLLCLNIWQNSALGARTFWLTEDYSLPWQQRWKSNVTSSPRLQRESRKAQAQLASPVWDRTHGWCCPLSAWASPPKTTSLATAWPSCRDISY